MRNSFLSPIPQIDQAVNYLDIAVDALKQQKVEEAGNFLVNADMPEIMAFYILIVGKTNPAIHWQSSQPKEDVPKALREKVRMPGKKLERDIYYRDGWRCRFCGTKVISRDVRNHLVKMFPEETHWVSEEYKRHSSLLSQAASIDHILPHSRGGDNAESNLVTACGPCQFGRNQWTLEEVGFNDPRERLPVVDSWDGLSRLVN